MKEHFLENPLVAISFVCFLWWFLTGIILAIVNWADNKGEKYHKYVTIALLPLLCVGFYGFILSVGDTSIVGAYFAFISSLCIWGWLELAFLTGIITGPNRAVKPVGLNGFKKFWLAWTSIAYAEVILILVLLVLFFFSAGYPNSVGFLTFLVLYVARLSAKLNLFFGVPKINIEFLPAPVRHLASHFKISRASWFFPISILFLIGLLIYWFNNFRLSAESSSEIIGFCFLFTLTTLALLEHLFMIVSFPDAALWRWMIPKSQSTTKIDLKKSETFPK